MRRFALYNKCRPEWFTILRSTFYRLFFFPYCLSRGKYFRPACVHQHLTVQDLLNPPRFARENQFWYRLGWCCSDWIYIDERLSWRDINNKLWERLSVGNKYFPTKKKSQLDLKLRLAYHLVGLHTRCFLISYIFWLWCLGENNSAFPVGWWPSWREKKCLSSWERKRISNAADGSIWFWTRSAF